MCNNLITSLSDGKKVHFPALISLYAAERRLICPRSTFTFKSCIITHNLIVLQFSVGSLLTIQQMRNLSASAS